MNKYYSYYTYYMTRITIVLDDKIDKKIRNRQAKKIMDTGRNFSFSACINEVLERGLK